jgi:hypothetical protein
MMHIGRRLPDSARALLVAFSLAALVGGAVILLQ